MTTPEDILKKSKPFYREIPAYLLKIDPSYQRALSLERVRQMRDTTKGNTGLNIDALGVLEISQRADGTFWIMDGQHRQAAFFQEAPDFPMPCNVHRGLTVEQEADLFYYFNGKRWRPSALDVFRSRLKAGHADSAEIYAIIREVGLDVSWSNDSGVDGTLTAIYTVQRIYQVGKADEVRETLKLLTDVWNGDRDALTSSFIGGANRFLRRYRGEFDREQLVKRLQGEFPRAIVLAAAKKHSLLGGDRPLCVALAFRDTYNRGRRSNQLPEWNDGHFSGTMEHRTRVAFATNGADDAYSLHSSSGPV